MAIPILSINLFLILLIIVFLHVKKVGNSKTRWLITCSLTIIFLSLAEGLYILTNIYLYFPAFAFWAAPFILLLGPSLYFFTKSITESDFKFNRKHLIHIVPFLIVLSVLQIQYQNLAYTEQLAILDQSLSGENPPHFVFVSVMVFFASIFIYLYFSFVLIKKYEAKLGELYSNFQNRDVDWIREILISFAIIIIISFIQNLLRLYSPGLWQISIVANLIIFIFIGSNLLFKFVDHRSLSIADNQYIKIDNEIKLKEIVEQANLVVQKEKLFLIEDINLKSLADKVGVKQNELSQAINFVEGNNFFDYINQYRINEAISLLTKHSAKDKNITEIMYSSGFNSKSSFNTAFKKFTGVTPSEYRKNRIS